MQAKASKDQGVTVQAAERERVLKAWGSQQGLEMAAVDKALKETARGQEIEKENADGAGASALSAANDVQTLEKQHGPDGTTMQSKEMLATLAS